MKIFANFVSSFILSIFFSVYFGNPLFAQTITRIQGSEVTISVPMGQKITVGDPISFTDQSLNTTARGTVQKVSEGGSIAIVAIKSGSAKQGHQIEFFRVVPATSPGVSSPQQSEVLSKEDRDILDRGEISTTRYVLGGLFSTWLGFGIGHAIQKRYLQKGWIFTAGEFATGMIFIAGAVECVSNNLGTWTSRPCTSAAATLGFYGMVGFRVWEIVDSWVAPHSMNDRYYQLKGNSKARWQGGIMPGPNGPLLTAQFEF